MSCIHGQYIQTTQENHGKNTTDNMAEPAEHKSWILGFSILLRVILNYK
jgi:hypothetical protein